MKISSITQANNINITASKDNKKVQNATTNSISRELTSNSLSEAIGRSQVSFTGYTKNTDKSVHHWSVLGRDFDYTKANGSFVYNKSSLFGLKKVREEYIPQERVTIVTERSKGITTTTETGPGYQVTTQTDKLGREFYCEEILDNGDRIESTVEFEKGRRINKRVSGKNVSFEVIDLETGKKVTNGPKTWQTYSRQDGKLIVKKNIVTGQILKQEKYEYPNKRNLLWSQERYEDTNGVKSELRYNKKERTYHIEHLDIHGNREYYEIEWEKEPRKKIYEYDTRTGQITSITEYIDDKHGDPLQEIHYVPKNDERERNNQISKVIDYIDGSEEDRFEHKYNLKTGKIALTTEFYGNEIYSITSYYQNGNKKECVEKLENDAYRTTQYASNGVEIKITDKDKNDRTYFEQTFDPRNGNILTESIVDRKSGITTNKEWDPITEFLLLHVEKYASGITKYKAEYFPQSGNLRYEVENFFSGKPKHEKFYFDSEDKIPREEKEYNSDGSYVYTTYYRNGDVKTRTRHNADGSIKQPKTYYSQTAQPKMTVEQAIESTLNKAALGRFEDITTQEYELLNEILELDSIDKIRNMDEATYKPLAFKYHPDRAPEDKKAEYEEIFKIVTLIYKSQKTRGKAN